jgi:hypothetical protein
MRMSTRGYFLGGTAIEAWSWPLTSIQCRGQECMELYLQYLQSPNTPSWCGAQLKHRDSFTFTLSSSLLSSSSLLVQEKCEIRNSIQFQYHQWHCNKFCDPYNVQVFYTLPTMKWAECWTCIRLATACNNCNAHKRQFYRYGSINSYNKWRNTIIVI